MTNFTTIAAIMVMAALTANAPAQEPYIAITSRSNEIARQIIVRSIYDFEQSISLKVKTDPSLTPSDVLIRMISKMGMVDARGIHIRSGFDIDMDNNLVVAYSGGTSEIIKAAGTPAGLNIIASFKDTNGNFVSPPPDSVSVYSIDGEKLCFKYNNIIKVPQKMAFTLLLDRSGSMYGEIKNVQASAKEFLFALPPSAECSVASFDHKFRYHNKRYQSCNHGDFKLDTLQAGGGTNLYKPLLQAYQSLSQPYFKDYQKAVIIITDGRIFHRAAQKQELQTAKKDILSFVYFLGSSTDEQLKDIANGYLHDPKNVKASLEQYFRSLSSAYAMQKVLSVQQCNSGHNAKP